MGVDAIVYRSVRNLPQGLSLEGVVIDKDTGEAYFEDTRPSNVPRDFAIAKAIHLGNIAEVGELRQEISRRLGKTSFIVRKILYSGSHSGDLVESSGLAEIEIELRDLENVGGLSEGLLSMISKIQDLVSEARRQDNPIVFV